MNRRELLFYFSKAEEAKDAFKSVYNDVLEYTHAIYDINDTMPINPTFARNIEPVISTSIQSFINFLMGTVFQRGQEWAKLQVNDIVYRNVSGLTVDALVDSKLQELNKQLEAGTKVVFDYLNNSNYYLEITKIATESMVLGTCAYKFKELNGLTKPFTFEHVPLDNFFFYEDESGKPDYCFRRFYDLNAQEITLMFKGATVPAKLLEDPIAGMDLLEAVVPIGNHKYKRIVGGTSLEDIILEEELPYNPYVVSRFNVEPNGIYGIGLGVQALETFKDLRYFKQVRKDQAEMLLKPPLKAVGDKALIQNARIKPGALNWGGNGNIDPKTGVANAFSLDPIITNVSLIPADQEIMKLEEEIKDIFISNPLGEITDYKNRTMYETESRLNLFRNRHASTFELLQTELLEPSLMLPFICLVQKGIIKFNLDDIDWFNLTHVSYVNELTKSKDKEDRTNLFSAIEATGVAMQKAPLAGLDPTGVGKEMLDSFEIDYGIRYTTEEQEKLKKQIELATIISLGGQNDKQTVQ